MGAISERSVPTGANRCNGWQSKMARIKTVRLVQMERIKTVFLLQNAFKTVFMFQKAFKTVFLYQMERIKTVFLVQMERIYDS